MKPMGQRSVYQTTMDPSAQSTAFQGMIPVVTTRVMKVMGQRSACQALEERTAQWHRQLADKSTPKAPQVAHSTI